jgi:hypothetical protein
LPGGGNRGDNDFFSTLTAHGHVGPGLLFWKRRINSSLTGEELLGCLQHFRWTAAGGCLLKRSIAL